MALYRSHIAPRLVNLACGVPGLRRWRRQACAGLSGVVVEIGFGSGRNVPFYPDDVELVHAVEPSDLAWRLAAARVAESGVRVARVGLHGQSVPLDSGSCDQALITFTLCTVPDPSLVLAEVTRVLRPGAELHFLEHGLAPDPSVARWQRRLDPWEQRVADGCHLTRDPLKMVRDAGLDIVWSEQRFEKGPQPWSYFTVGVARTPVAQDRRDANDA